MILNYPISKVDGTSERFSKCSMYQNRPSETDGWAPGPGVLIPGLGREEESSKVPSDSVAAALATTLCDPLICLKPLFER